MTLSSALQRAVLAILLVAGVGLAAAAQTPGAPVLTSPRSVRSTVEMRFSFDFGSDKFQGFDWTSPSLPRIGESMGQGNTYGLWMFVRTNRYFDIFSEIAYHKTQLLVGAAGEALTGGYFDDYGAFGLWEDVFYRSNNLLLRLGGRFIYPLNRWIEPWIGLAYGLNIWNVRFFNEGMTDFYSDQIWGVNAASFFLLGGVDFILRAGDKRLLTLGLHIDYGRSPAKPLTIDNFFYSIPWTCETAPGIPALKLGISLGGGF